MSASKPSPSTREPAVPYAARGAAGGVRGGASIEHYLHAASALERDHMVRVRRPGGLQVMREAAHEVVARQAVVTFAEAAVQVEAVAVVAQGAHPLLREGFALTATVVDGHDAVVAHHAVVVAARVHLHPGERVELDTRQVGHEEDRGERHERSRVSRAA